MNQNISSTTSTRTIAIIGASTRPEKYGNRAVRAYRAAGWRVYPIHPTASAIAGIPAFRDVRDIPGPVHRASIYLPPEKTALVLPGLAAKGVGEVFLNPGAADARVVALGEELGLVLVQACSIVDIGRSPDHPD